MSSTIDALTRLEAAVNEAAACLAILKQSLDAGQPLNRVSKPPVGLKDPAKTPNLTSFSVAASSLGPMLDYKSEAWPEAIDPKAVINPQSQSEQKYRAVQVISMIKERLIDKKVLDFGCGNGYVAIEASYTSAQVIGYDIREDPWWSHPSHKVKFTTDKLKMIDQGPYDLIILYDVLDHVIGASVEDIIFSLPSMLTPEGTIFIRTHPWTSRTGGHLYETHNKAYLHLALTPDELAQEGITLQPNSRIVRPMAAYELWFKQAGLSVKERKLKTTVVDPFFQGDILDRIIKINWGGKLDHGTARKIMSNHFIDYKLTLDRSPGHSVNDAISVPSLLD